MLLASPRPPVGAVLCDFADLTDPGSLGIELPVGDVTYLGFVVRSGDQVRAYVDWCPHQGLRMGYRNQFLTPTGEIICRAHYVRFDAMTGQGLDAPYTCDQLAYWPVAVVDGKVVMVEPAQAAAEPA